MKESITVFISYAHEDDLLRKELNKHLSLLKSQNIISPWDDQDINAGTEWEGEIIAHLYKADVILLLISPDFLASNYCYSTEMKQAMEMHEASKAIVIPIILRPVVWEGAPFGKLQALPKNAQPVTSWKDRDEAFKNIAQGIQAMIEERWPYGGNLNGNPTEATKTNFEAFREAYQQWRKALTLLIQKLITNLSGLEMSRLQDRVQQIQERVNTDKFKFLLMGEYNRGKSTLINALLGERVLPVDEIRTTGIICEVKWGEERKAILHYFDAGTSPSEQTREISIDDIEKYITVQDDNTHKPHMLEIFLPLNFCRDGIEIIDSPGLNEAESRDKITLGYLSSADAVAFVISCDYQVSKTEEWAIQTTVQTGIRNIFFVCNKIDLPRDKEKVKRQILTKIGPYLKDRKNILFFISAKDALEGRHDKDIDKLNMSNMLPFEQELWAFLVSEKGRTKLQRAINELKILLKEDLQNEIKSRRKTLLSNMNDLNIQNDNASQKKNAKIAKYEKDLEEIEGIGTKAAVKEAALGFLDEIAENIEAWMYRYRYPDQSIEWWQREKRLTLMQAQARLIKDFANYLNVLTEQAFKDWQDLKLKPLVQKNLRALKLSKKASDLLDKSLDKLLEDGVGTLSQISPVYRRRIEEAKKLGKRSPGTKELISNDEELVTTMGREYAKSMRSEQKLRNRIARHIAKVVDDKLTARIEDKKEDIEIELRAKAQEEQNKRKSIDQENTRLDSLSDGIEAIDKELDSLTQKIALSDSEALVQ